MSMNEQQSLTELLAKAIEERRRQMHKNEFESGELSPWEDEV
jgi:hypothetical protein